MNKDELLEWLDEKVNNYDDQAYQEIKAIITRFDEECVKSFDAGYKAGVVESTSKEEDWDNARDACGTPSKSKA